MVPTLNSYLSYHTIKQLQPLQSLCLMEVRAFSLTVPLYTLQSVMPALAQ